MPVKNAANLYNVLRIFRQQFWQTIQGYLETLNIPEQYHQFISRHSV